MLRSIAARRAQALPQVQVRCDASRSMRANPITCPHPSRRAHAPFEFRGAPSACALLRMRTAEPAAPRRTVFGNFQLTMSNSPSRSRGACLRPGFATLASPTRIEGWAERRETFGCSAEHPWGLHMTRQARRLRGALRPIARQDARERAYDAGRSPLGAPPWRFFTRGRASVSGMTPDPLSELLAARS